MLGGREVTRLEGFSDAFFGFALTRPRPRSERLARRSASVFLVVEPVENEVARPLTVVLDSQALLRK
ncbi:MAG TPA: hypothetical protein VJ648_03510 [Vicinamibacteria bacterium]|nr:hypothetical protein [Vicinamibacteria bacterium]